MIFMALILCIVALDLCVKTFVHGKLAIGEKRQCKCKRLFVWHIKNKGIAYNYLEGQKKEILLLTAAGIASFFCMLKKEWQNNGYTIMGFAMALLLGGALGNFLERIKKGYVTDYIYIKAKGAAVFNIADLFIALGTIVFCLSSLFKKEKL